MMRASLACAAVAALACVAPVLGGGFGGETRIRSLARYFDQVLDHDSDGLFTQREHQAHLESLDPESYPTLPLELTNVRHGELDLNGDAVVTLPELCRVLDICTEEEAQPDRLDAILANTSNEPVQVHLAATTTYGEMIVNWAQAITDLDNAEVRWGTEPGQYSNGAQATYQTYSVSLYGMKYTSLPLFNVSMTGLAPLTRYYYIVGSPNDGFSPEHSFLSLPDPSVPITQQNTTRMVVYGDQGTIIPMGATVCQWVEAEQAQNPFNALLHVGDLAYAGVSHSMGEYEPTWDSWMQQISGIGAQMPYMTSVGNHENFFNYASYLARFNMPGPASGGNTSFWWSFDLGSIHVTSFSSESDYNPGSVQYAWIEADLAAARANPNTKWLLFAGHRPFYSSDTDELNMHVPGAPMLVALEPLLNKYAVDMVLTGHEHMYERTWPVNNGTVFNATAPGACQGVKDHELGMMNEKKAFWDEIDPSLPLHVFDKDVAAEATAPVYIVQATAGIFQFDKVVDPQPAWSASRLVGTFGYGVLSVSTTASGCSSLLYQFRTNVNGAVQVIDQVLLTHQVTATGKPEKESIFIADM